MNSIRWLIDLLRTSKLGKAGFFFFAGLGVVLAITLGNSKPPPAPVAQTPGPNTYLLKLCEKVAVLDDCDYTYRGRIICREPPSHAYILDDPTKCRYDEALHNRIMQRFRAVPRSVDPLDAPRQIPAPDAPSSRGDGG